MEPLSPDSAPTFFVLRALQRYWRTIAITAVVITVLAGGYEALTSRAYTSQATVQVRPLVGNAFSPDTAGNSTVALQTEAQLVASADVATLVNKVTSSCDVGSVSATVLANALLIKVSYVSKRAATARTCATDYAANYLKNRTALAVATQTTQTNSLNKAVNNTVALLNRANAQVASKDPSIDRVAAKADVERYTSQRTTLLTQIGQIAALSTNPGDVVVPAGLPTDANGIEPILVILAAIVVGLLLGALLAIWRGRRDRRILTETHATNLGLPVLATVVSARGEPTGAPLPAAVSDEEFRMAAISVLAGAGGHTAIAVSPMSALESAAAVSIRLARGIAAAGYTVVLVDAVTEGPQVGALLEAEPRVGLSDILGGAGFDTVSLFEFDGLEVLTAGTDPIAGGRRHSGARIRELLTRLKEAADFVLISTSAVTTSDGLGVLLAADHAVVVADDHATTYENIAEVKALAARLGVDVLGLVVAREARPTASPPDTATSRGTEALPAAPVGAPRRARRHAHAIENDASIDKQAPSEELPPPEPGDTTSSAPGQRKAGPKR